MRKWYVDQSVIFGYDLKADAWSGCGCAQWWRIGQWPAALPWTGIELEGHTFRRVMAADLAACGIDGAALHQQLLCRVEPLVEAH